MSSQEYRMSPRDTMYDFGVDPYNGRLQQFVGLIDLGYPVDLIPLRKNQLGPSFRFPGQYSDDCEYLQWQVEHHSQWLRPVVTNPDFATFVEDPDVLGDFSSGDEDFDDTRYNHPMRLISEIDKPDVSGLAAISRAVSEDGDPKAWHYEDRPGIDVTELIPRAFVAAITRHAHLFDQGYPFAPHQDYSLQDVELYADCRRSGIVGLDPEQLGGLVIDYYTMLEDHVPAFAAFKK